MRQNIQATWVLPQFCLLRSAPSRTLCFLLLFLLLYSLPLGGFSWAQQLIQHLAGARLLILPLFRSFCFCIPVLVLLLLVLILVLILILVLLVLVLVIMLAFLLGRLRF